MFPYKGNHCGFAFFAQFPKAPCAVFTKHLKQITLVYALTAAQLSSIAPRSPKAYALRVKHDDAKSRFCQMQRRRQPRESGSDHTNISRLFAFNGRTGRQKLTGRSIPTRRVGSLFIVRIKKIHLVTRLSKGARVPKEK